MKKHKERHQNPAYLPQNKDKEAIFSLDDFVAKINKKGQNILKCRKCLRKCKDIKGAKMHLKLTKSCQVKEHSMRVLKKANKTITGTSSGHVGQSKNLNFTNQVQEILKVKTSTKLTKVSKVPKSVTSLPKNVQRLKNVTLSVGNKVINNISEITSMHTFECKLCQKLCSSKQQLDRHMQVAHPVKTYNCTSCPKKFTKNLGLVKHHQSSPACLILFKKKKSSKRTNKQIVSHNFLTTTSVNCDQCKKICKSLRYLRMHKNVKHGQASPVIKL